MDTRSEVVAQFKQVAQEQDKRLAPAERRSCPARFRPGFAAMASQHRGRHGLKARSRSGPLQRRRRRALLRQPSVTSFGSMKMPQNNPPSLRSSIIAAGNLSSRILGRALTQRQAGANWFRGSILEGGTDVEEPSRRPSRPIRIDGHHGPVSVLHRHALSSNSTAWRAASFSILPICRVDHLAFPCCERLLLRMSIVTDQADHSMNLHRWMLLASCRRRSSAARSIVPVNA